MDSQNTKISKQPTIFFFENVEIPRGEMGLFLLEVHEIRLIILKQKLAFKPKYPRFEKCLLTILKTKLNNTLT